MFIDIIRHILPQFAEGLAGHGQRGGIAGAVHHDIQEVNAPVNQCAAAGDGFGGERPAEPGNGAMGTEGHIYMMHGSKLAGIDVFLDPAHTVVKAVHDADVQHLAGLMLHFLHFQRFRIGPCGGLFTKHMLAGPQGIHGDGGMHIVGRADGNRFHFRILQDIMVVLYGNAAPVLFHGCRGPLGNDIAKILDLDFRIIQVGRDMRRVGNGAAADYSNEHGVSPFI